MFECYVYKDKVQRGGCSFFPSFMFYGVYTFLISVFHLRLLDSTYRKNVHLNTIVQDTEHMQLVNCYT